jgi:hypothetical protein
MCGATKNERLKFQFSLFLSLCVAPQNPQKEKTTIALHTHQNTEPKYVFIRGKVGQNQNTKPTSIRNESQLVVLPFSKKE